MSAYLAATPALGTLTSILLNGGEGRGEEALIKTSAFASLRFHHWFVGSNVKTPANAGLYPGPNNWFSYLSGLGNPPSILSPSAGRRCRSAGL